MKNSKKQTSKSNRCHKCGAESKELVEFDNKKWCLACLEEKTGICERCENRFYREELIAFDDQLWCEDCLSGETATCADCGERVYLDEVTYVGDDPI
jgi:formylmethanofuran dehydrogenase subunit E